MDKLKARIETDEYIFEEYEDGSLPTDDHPSTHMNAWIRSLVHLQASPDAPTTPPPECIRQACYEAGQINSCECNYCLPQTQEEESE